MNFSSYCKVQPIIHTSKTCNEMDVLHDYDTKHFLPRDVLTTDTCLFKPPLATAKAALRIDAVHLIGCRQYMYKMRLSQNLNVNVTLYSA